MTEPSTDVAVREHADALPQPLAPMDDAEMARLYRTAKALAESRLFKDATQAGQAFAKILAGRDLGLTPFESMGQLHVIEGKVEASSDLHASRVRQREGYDFRVAWLKADGQGNDATTVAVWADEEELADLRLVVGCAIVFLVDGEQRGVSRWTVADSQTAGLVKDKGAHQKFPRSMYFARAMTNGVAWYVPEVMGGMRVYGIGEIERAPDDSAGVGSGEAVGADLPTEVEAILARAQDLGHVGLANRSSAELALKGQPRERVAQWVAAATKALNRLARARAAAEQDPDGARAAEAAAAATPEEEPKPEAEPAAEEVDGETVAEDENEFVERTQRAADLATRAHDADDAAQVAEDRGEEDRAAELRAEAAQLRTEAEAAGDPGQGDLFDGES